MVESIARSAYDSSEVKAKCITNSCDASVVIMAHTNASIASFTAQTAIASSVVRYIEASESTPHFDSSSVDLYYLGTI